jgi:periplasmic protein TonB
MFETVVSLEAKKSRARSYRALPASLVVHGAIAGAVILGGLSATSFPDQPPRVSVAYSLTEDPPPPPPPPPPPAAAKAQPVQQAVQQQPPPGDDEIVAPTVIPDTIVPASLPIVADVGPIELLGGSGGVAGGVDGGVATGVAGGSEDGVGGGEVGGTVGGTLGGVVVIPRDQPLRMLALSQTYPVYPERARIRGWEDRLVVRYIIGTDGKVREVSIVEPSERKLFADATLRAIRHWRFRPMMKDGQAQEVVHELTIYYRLQV